MGQTTSPSWAVTFYRAYGTFEQPNPYAGYMGMILSLAQGCRGALGRLWQTLDHEDTDGRPSPVSQLPVTLALLGLSLPGTVTHGSCSGYVLEPGGVDGFRRGGCW